MPFFTINLAELQRFPISFVSVRICTPYKDSKYVYYAK